MLKILYSYLFIVCLSSVGGYIHGEHALSKRVLPTNLNCDPFSEVCRKGDWIATNIADCKYERSFYHPFVCTAQHKVWYSWIVDVAKGDRCKPISGEKFQCGASGTNTRCVCSDTNLIFHRGFNKCRCQYWPSYDPGRELPGFCTGYYTGGTSSLHHWACCNNCNDSSSRSCDGYTWQGGTKSSYCGACGQSTGGGRVKNYFNCGSCSYQKACEKICNRMVSTRPGFCWKWLECFKGCCFSIAQQPDDISKENRTKTGTIVTFCGDGTCDDGTETSSTCPIDCCSQINATCVSDTQVCTPACCQTPDCCTNSFDNTSSATHAPSADMGIVDSSVSWFNGGTITGIILASLLTLVFVGACVISATVVKKRYKYRYVAV